MANKVMKVHPLCQQFSRMAPLPPKERAEMQADIKENGIKVPILIDRKKTTILDGLTRWKMAHDLNLKLKPENFEVFQGEEADIEKEILSRNLFRRHMDGDQRVAIVSMIRGPQLEQEAKERQSTAGSFKGKKNGKAKPEVSGSVAAHIAKEAGVSQHKAEQAEKARKSGVLGDVVAGKTKLRSAAKSAGKKPRKPKKETPFEDQVYKKWTQFINRYAPPVRRRVMDLIKGWIGK
jgi:hypothetical protein